MGKAGQGWTSHPSQAWTQEQVHPSYFPRHFFYVVLAVLNYVDKVGLKLKETLLLLPSGCWIKGVRHHPWLLRVSLECYEKHKSFVTLWVGNSPKCTASQTNL